LVPPTARDSHIAMTVGPMPPYAQFHNFLDRDLHQALLDWVAGHRGDFDSATVTKSKEGHGDRLPHLDIPIGLDRRPLGARKGEDRVISAVYYFHNIPKGFSGGNLRLFRFGSEEADDGVAIEPIDNSLVVFPSWVRHQVERVSCPSGDFADYRYAVNCWYCRPLDAQPPAR